MIACKAVREGGLVGAHGPPVAVLVYVRVAIAKKRLDLDASLYTLRQILSVTLFENMPLRQALDGVETRPDAPEISNQLNLFAF